MGWHKRLFTYPLLGALWFLAAAFAPPGDKLKKITFGSGMSAQVPAEFQVMPDEGIAVKYPSPRRPLAAWSSASGHVDFVVTEKSTPFRPGDVQVLLNVYKANIMNIYSGQVVFKQQQVVLINGQEFAAFEFTSTLAPDPDGTKRSGAMRRYNYLMYTILPPATSKDRPHLLSVVFACPAVLAADWEPLAQRVMASVKVR